MRKDEHEKRMDTKRKFEGEEGSREGTSMGENFDGGWLNDKDGPKEEIRLRRGRK